MTIYVRQSQINDPIPSARGVTASVRSVLWGIVTTIAERNGSDEGGVSLDGSLLEREDDFFASAVALARVQLEEEMKIFQESSMELDDECVMPLAFGKKKKRKRKSKVEVNLVPGRCPLKSPSGLSYYFHFDGIPDDFVWNVYLPLPAEEYVEENLFGLALPSNAPGAPGVHRYVRIMGCGHSSSSDADAALGTENCITGQALIRSQQTVIVETLGCDQTDGRLEVDRCNLLTVRKSEAQRVKEMLLENLYSTRVEGSTHYGTFHSIRCDLLGSPATT